MSEVVDHDKQDKQDPKQYWGYLFQRNKSPTDKLDRLLRGLATCIVRS